MSDRSLSRRRLVSGAAAAGTVGLLTLGTTATARAAEQRTPGSPPAEQPPALDEPMVVHLRDVRTGELDLFTGDRHHRVRNPELAAALVRALG